MSPPDIFSCLFPLIFLRNSLSLCFSQPSSLLIHVQSRFPTQAYGACDCYVSLAQTGLVFSSGLQLSLKTKVYLVYLTPR